MTDDFLPRSDILYLIDEDIFLPSYSMEKRLDFSMKDLCIFYVFFGKIFTIQEKYIPILSAILPQGIDDLEEQYTFSDTPHASDHLYDRHTKSRKDSIEIFFSFYHRESLHIRLYSKLYDKSSKYSIIFEYSFISPLSYIF